jgi:L-aspartate oxidase
MNTRRYLVGVDTHALPQVFTDCLVIGGGVGGLRAAVEAASAGDVLVVTKDAVRESNTFYAQGGIAAVLGPEDTFDSHIEDTLATGCGLCDREVVRRVVEEGPARVLELLDWGAKFDTVDTADGKRLAFGREGGHSANRIIHAMGDSTGREIALTLHAKARGHPRVRLMENTFAVDLLTVDGECVGALVSPRADELLVIHARHTVLATGGCGQLWRETTNPRVATGDGHAMAYRAGAVMRDMEMVQFHPTTLYVAGATRALITEAVRGEGGRLVDRTGRRFMPDYHPQAELAPRDVVSRAIVKQMEKTGATHVFLDMTHLGPAVRDRFPGITKLCEGFGLDITRDRIPVRPSAHYMIGGAAVDEAGRTGIRNLWACGEVTRSGLHGANRLASNSLLEGLVFGQAAGAAIAADLRDHGPNGDTDKARRIRFSPPASARTELDVSDVRTSLRSLMTRNVGIERNEARLAETEEIIEFWCRYVLDKVFTTPEGWELQNMLTVARLVAHSARQRTETRGVHYRSDHPDRDDPRWLRPTEIHRDGGV